jgi:hypothetical protein
LAKHQKTDIDYARDELMSHIHRCGVLKASPEQQEQWLGETMEYMAERYTNLTEKDLSELRGIGSRFCQPVIGRGPLPTPGDAVEPQANSDEMAGAA